MRQSLFELFATILGTYLSLCIADITFTDLADNCTMVSVSGQGICRCCRGSDDGTGIEGRNGQYEGFNECLDPPSIPKCKAGRVISCNGNYTVNTAGDLNVHGLITFGHVPAATVPLHSMVTL
jgi:hypothetical protein